MAGYYRKFIQGFSTIAQPLTNLLKDQVPFHWDTNCEQGFQTLKEKLCSSPILTYPDFKQEFFVETDASSVGIGAVLSQYHADSKKMKPIAYCSRLLKGAELNFSTTDREALAIIWSLKKFRYVVHGYPITVLTDHKPLTSLFTSTLPPGRLGRWALLVQEFGIKIRYKPGRLNMVPDALSRYPAEDDDQNEEVNEGKVNLVSKVVRRNRQPVAAWSVDILKAEQKGDDVFGPIYEYLESNQTSTPPEIPSGFVLTDFCLSGGILHVKQDGVGTREGQTLTKVVVPNSLINNVIWLYHNHVAAGHRGMEQTREQIKQRYVCIGLTRRIHDYISQCTICHQFRKYPRKASPMYAYEITPRPFHQIHMDLLGPLPTTPGGKRYIITYVDRFTRYTILDALENRTAITVAKSLYNRVIAEYTTPEVIVSDNALEFTSEVIHEMCKFLKIQKTTVTAYMPAANGLAEAANKRILGALKVAVNKSQTDWDTILPSVQIALNTAYHHAIGDTPHYLVFLQDKIAPFELHKDTGQESGDEFLAELHRKRKVAYDAAQQELANHEERFRTKYNKKAVAYKIRVGNRVYIETRVPPKRSPKLYPKYEGPFRVISDLKRERYMVKNLINGREKKIHGKHVKVVPELETTITMNSNVKQPHPHLNVDNPEPMLDTQSDLPNLTVLPPAEPHHGSDEEYPKRTSDLTREGRGRYNLRPRPTKGPWDGTGHPVDGRRVGQGEGNRGDHTG